MIWGIGEFRRFSVTDICNFGLVSLRFQSLGRTLILRRAFKSKLIGDQRIVQCFPSANKNNDWIECKLNENELD